MRVLFSAIRLILGFAFFLLLLIVLLGPPLYLEIGGEVAPGAVIAKRETIKVIRTSWSRRLFIDVRYQPAGADQPVETDIAVDLATYDRLAVGTPVDIRYIPHPTIQQIGNLAKARLVSQPPMASFTALLGNQLYKGGMAIAGWFGLLLIWNKYRYPPLLPLLAVLMLGGSLYLALGWPPSPPPGTQVGGVATVREVHAITRIWEGQRSAGEDAVQPYLIVELVFVPEGARDPVVAVDQVDLGSVPRLERGAAVPVSYSRENPRHAWIAGASRTFYWKNLRTLGILLLVIGVALLALWLRRRHRRAPSGRP